MYCEMNSHKNKLREGKGAAPPPSPSLPAYEIASLSCRDNTEAKCSRIICEEINRRIKGGLSSVLPSIYISLFSLSFRVVLAWRALTTRNLRMCPEKGCECDGEEGRRSSVTVAVMLLNGALEIVLCLTLTCLSPHLTHHMCMRACKALLTTGPIPLV